MTKRRDHSVGYGKPPTASQFKPGKSGNPRGRPVIHTGMTDRIGRKMLERRAVSVNGRVRNLSISEILIEKLFEHAAKGNMKAALILFDATERFQAKQRKKFAAETSIKTREELSKMSPFELNQLYRETLARAHGEEHKDDDD